jgi:hypothetical protein
MFPDRLLGFTFGVGVNRTQFFPYRRWDRGWNDPQDFDKAEHGRSMLYGASAGDGDENDDQCRQLLDRAGQASWRVGYDGSADGGSDGALRPRVARYPR